MIHYTLLPEEKVKIFKKEYRSRLFIILAFFVSSAIIIGIISLFPSYILSYSRQNDSIEAVNSLKAKKEESGMNTLIKELSQSQDLLKKIKASQDTFSYSDFIKEIVNEKPRNVAILSLHLSKSQTATSTVDMDLQGKALTREDLLNFKNILGKNANIVKVDLPVSDLTKSKDVLFTLHIKLKSL